MGGFQKFTYMAWDVSPKTIANNTKLEVAYRTIQVSSVKISLILSERKVCGFLKL